MYEESKKLKFLVMSPKGKEKTKRILKGFERKKGGGNEKGKNEPSYLYIQLLSVFGQYWRPECRRKNGSNLSCSYSIEET